MHKILDKEKCKRNLQFQRWLIKFRWRKREKKLIFISIDKRLSDRY